MASTMNIIFADKKLVKRMRRHDAGMVLKTQVVPKQKSVREFRLFPMS